MIELFKYTDREIKEILKSMVVLVDTREQENSHIIDYFNKRGILFKNHKLYYGDYSCMIPKSEEHGISRDIYFDNTLVIERKGSLEELSGNFTKDRNRIEEEFTRAKGKVNLMIEGAVYEDIIKHNYNTQYDPKSFIATLKAFEARYGINISFISKLASGNFIYHTLYYHIREYLKH